MQDTGPGNGKNAGWCEAGMPGVLARLLPLGQLPGALAQLLPLDRLPGALARLLPPGRLPGALARLRILGRRLGLWLGLPRKSSCVF